MTSSDVTTQGIRVQVSSELVPERSEPARNNWLFAYHVRITNRSAVTVQLLRRHWVITDANGAIQEVRGEGVIGEQPVLAPGEVHEYSSFCPLRTSFGTMQGSYVMAVAGAEDFEAEVAPFVLGEPTSIN